MTNLLLVIDCAKEEKGKMRVSQNRESIETVSSTPHFLVSKTFVRKFDYNNKQALYQN